MKTEEHPVAMMELNNYIDSLFAELDIAFKAKMRHDGFEILSMIALFVSFFVGQGWFIGLMWFVFWTTHGYGHVILSRRVHYLLGEIDGCFKTLEILGILEKGEWTGRKKPKVRDIYAPLVKKWHEFKERVQKEMWGNAPMPVPAMSVNLK